MTIDYFPLLSYVVIATFTPGPANITSASMGLMYGYRKTLNFLIGLWTGYFIVLLVTGWISETALNLFPSLGPTLRYFGAAYILYLAYKMLLSRYNFTESEIEPLGFTHGVFLQISNPKLMVFTFTLFSAFLAPITSSFFLLFLSTAALTLFSITATSSWALFGTGIKTFLKNPRTETFVNITLALLLVYTAVNIL